MSVYVRVCVCGVSECAMLSSWHSSTNLSSIQIFHSDGKRPDSNSWEVSISICRRPFLQQNLSRVERSNAPTRSNVGPSNDIHMSNPRLRPGGGGGGGVSRNNDRRIIR